MTRMPQPTQADKELRTERVALDSKARLSLFKNFMPVLVMLFFANLFVTVLQDIKEDFLVKILDVDAGIQNSLICKLSITKSPIDFAVPELIAMLNPIRLASKSVTRRPSRKLKTA